jgi:hypothetical protein
VTHIPGPLEWFVSLITKAEAETGNAHALSDPSGYMQEKLVQYAGAPSVLQGITELHEACRKDGTLAEPLWTREVKPKTGRGVAA